MSNRSHKICPYFFDKNLQFQFRPYQTTTALFFIFVPLFKNSLKKRKKLISQHDFCIHSLPTPCHQPYPTLGWTTHTTHTTQTTHHIHNTHNTHNTHTLHTYTTRIHTTHYTHNTHNSHNTHNTHLFQNIPKDAMHKMNFEKTTNTFLRNELFHTKSIVIVVTPLCQVI